MRFLRCSALAPVLFLCLSLHGSALPARAAECDSTSTGATPLTDLGPGMYQGYEGGLYPGGVSQPPVAHLEAGLEEVLAMTPLDTLGMPDDDGWIVLLSIGMCNTSQEFAAFMSLAGSYPGRNMRVFFVNGAQGAATAAAIADENAPYWATVDQKLAQQGLSRLQVQAIWFKEANGAPTEAFPGHALILRDQFRSIMQILRNRFQNARACYLSSRIYGGYASTALNPEPYAYEGAFAIKWLIEEQIAGSAALNFDPSSGPVIAPWLSWGPYFWADGLIPRSDGLTWVCSDFADDGTHPGPVARSKVANMLLDFLIADDTARIWFLQNPSSAGPVPPERGLMIQPPTPNPFRTGTAFHVAIETARDLRISIYAPSGRRVKILGDRRFEPGNWRFFWDGTDSQGRPVGPGMYFLGVQDGEHVLGSHKLVLTR